MKIYSLPTLVNTREIRGNKTFCYSPSNETMKSRGYDKYKTCDIYVAKTIIHIEKYSTEILTWNRKTKRTTFSKYGSLYQNKGNDLKIVLMEGKYMSFHDFHVAWSHLHFVDIYTNLDELTVPLNDRYSYIIQSTDICTKYPEDLTSYS